MLLAQARCLAASAVWTCTKSKPTQAAMAYHEAAITTATIRLAEGPPTNSPLPPGWQPPSLVELAVQCQLLRDIFGNPFRAMAFDPTWRTATTVSLAGVMFKTRDFAAMPILADALEDAGCESRDLLDHCRGDGLHVRGCWVINLLRKE
jgi:hypothetical protein